MAYTSKKLINEKLKAALREYRTLYEQTAEESRQDALRKLPAGSTMLPQIGRILDEDRKQSFTEKASAIKARALDELSEWRKTVDKLRTDPPTEEALRAIQAFQMRDPKGMTHEQYQQEAQALADRYGSNYQTYQVIRDVAAKGGARVESNPIIADLETFEVVESNISRYLDPSNALHPIKPSPPSAAGETFMGMFLDDVMGIDPSA